MLGDVTLTGFNLEFIPLAEDVISLEYEHAFKELWVVSLSMLLVISFSKHVQDGLTITSGVQDGSLEDNEWRCNRILDLDFDGIREILGHGGHCQKICRSYEEVAVERRHAEI